jgi:hypothetical protein
MSAVVGPIRKGVLGFLERRAADRREALVEEVERLKQSLGFTDEFGQRHPFTVSAAVPVFLRDRGELSSYRFEVIRNELIELGHLLRRGVIDEIIIVDGSTKGFGTIDDSLMKLIVSTMNRSLSIFHDQVDFIQKYRALRNKAVLGLYDFGVRVVHQLDPEINKILKTSKILPQGLTTGKGVALWLATAISSGDIVCFMDSDIRNFQEWQVAALIKPILESWTRSERSMLYSKACYTRLAVNLDSPEKGFYKLGGRATRLFVIPLIRTLSKRGALKGLEKLRYPLSGEFAGTRELLESIEFSSGYDAEMAILTQLWKRSLVERIAQVDLGLFQHFPQTDKAIHQMVKQITQLIVTELKDRVNFDEKLVDEYVLEAIKDVKSTQAMYEKAEIRLKIEHEVKRDFYKDEEGDKNKVLAYAEELRTATVDPKLSQKTLVQRLPSWSAVARDERGTKLVSFIRRRATTSTVELLSKQGLVTL